MSGIGLAIAKAFDSEDVNLFLQTRNRGKHKTKVFKSRTEILEFDVRDESSIDVVIDDLKNRQIFFDVVINSAGSNNDKLFVQMSHEDFFGTMDTNFSGVARVIEKFLPLINRPGSIINIASIIGLTGNVGQVDYATSKSALIEMTKYLATEYATDNIVVNAIAPGMIETKMTDAMTGKAKAYAENLIPMKRFGKPEEVADLVIAVSKGTYLTGQTFIVDGGLYMR